MAWIDMLRQLGNFNWGPGWCNNIVTILLVLVNRVGGVSLHMISVSRLTDGLDITLIVLTGP